MLNNIFFLPSTTLSIKNNFFFINWFCYKLTSWFLMNTNIYNIYIFEKTIIDYNLKQLYFSIINYSYFTIFFIQCLFLLFIF